MIFPQGTQWSLLIFQHGFGLFDFSHFVQAILFGFGTALVDFCHAAFKGRDLRFEGVIGNDDILIFLVQRLKAKLVLLEGFFLAAGFFPLL